MHSTQGGCTLAEPLGVYVQKTHAVAMLTDEQVRTESKESAGDNPVPAASSGGKRALASTGAQSRRWCFTLNNPSEVERVSIEVLAHSAFVTALTYGREIGESGTPHLQGAIVFKIPQRFNAVRKMLPRAHLEQMKGTSKQAFDYCHKEDKEPFLYGEVPEEAGIKEKIRWQQVRELAQAGKLEEIDPEPYIRYYSTLNRIAQDCQVVPSTIDELSNEWIWGASGSGKSRYARRTYPGAYIKNLNKWWCGYNNERTVLVEDVDPSHATWLGYFLKIWGDHYPFRGEKKGGSVMARPDRIIITSQYPPEDVFPDPETVAAIRRRYKVHHYGGYQEINK